MKKIWQMAIMTSTMVLSTFIYIKYIDITQKIELPIIITLISLISSILFKQNEKPKVLIEFSDSVNSDYPLINFKNISNSFVENIKISISGIHKNKFKENLESLQANQEIEVDLRKIFNAEVTTNKWGDQFVKFPKEGTFTMKVIVNYKSHLGVKRRDSKKIKIRITEDKIFQI